MKLLFITYVCIMSALVCKARKEDNLETIKNDTLSLHSSEDMQGLWRSNWIEYIPALPNADDPLLQIHHENYIYIEGDSIWALEYPCMVKSVAAWSLTDFQFLNDSTLKYGREFYSRMNYDTASIATLKKNKINLNCFIGKWELVRTESGGDGTGVVYILPFQIEDTISFNEKTFEGNVMKVPIQGSKRDFHFTLVKKGFSDELILSPTDSWSEKDKVMWLRYWDLPPPDKKELEQIRKEKGIELTLRFRKVKI